jgi:hypothetical protein
MVVKKIASFIFFAFLNSNLFPQTPSYPPAIDLFEYNDISFKELIDISDIRIWGWSRDGKVAYSNDYYTDGYGGYTFMVAIFDLVEDTTVWENSAHYFEEFDEAYNSLMDSFVDMCEQNAVEFTQSDFMELPIKYNNQEVKIIVEETEFEEDDYMHDPGSISGYKIIAENNGKQKIIKEDAELHTLNIVFECGYFISPFENRALIIIGVNVRAFEGYELRYILVGCHLSDGFK